MLDSCDSYDLTISIKKTEVVYQPVPGKPYKEPTITVKGQRLQVVDKFTYLGRSLSRVVHIDDEVNARTAKASAAFGRPTESWEQIAQDRTKWRSLIRRGAGEYEAKRISEAEQKRAQQKARAKASLTELSSSDLSCSICNRQFRAKVCLISHLRTHK